MSRQRLGLPRSQRSQGTFRGGYSPANTKPKHGSYISSDRFINKAEPVETAEVFIPRHKFADFPFDERLHRNIVAKGYEIPTPIQDEAIVPVMAGRDLIGLANTGTGKTAAFLLPIINRFLVERQGLALIVVPTRELANQIDEEFKGFARGLNLYSALLVGGASMGAQINALQRRPQFVIGTPGRIKDLINQGRLRLQTTSVLVLDEADRMVDMGFIRDIRFIIGQLPEKRQSLCLSATMTPEIERLVNELQINPIKVSVRTSETSDHVEQNIIKAVSRDHKTQILRELLGQPEFSKVLIFGDTKYGVQRLADNLAKDGIKTAAIHGNKSQPQRQRALEAFKKEQVQVLVATDVAARGLDIPNVTHVINYDQPKTYDDYVHRIGRTGRAGARGNALTFVQG
ncbi:MAG TPA: DEAD/DEAH box helicase [Candidatus Nanoarchaeia archaeon]|nr:DEAD/DEAH box helicase [Candidatus Nanoarchaeia archaeon]